MKVMFVNWMEGLEHKSGINYSGIFKDGIKRIEMGALGCILLVAIFRDKILRNTIQ